MAQKTPREFFYLGAIVVCREVLGIEPTDKQLEQAADIADEIKRQSTGLFMYGFELKQQALRIVAEANGIPPSVYELKPERKRRKKGKKPQNTRTKKGKDRRK